MQFRCIFGIRQNINVDEEDGNSGDINNNNSSSSSSSSSSSNNNNNNNNNNSELYLPYTSLNVFHQNIRGLKLKANELLSSYILICHVLSV